MDVEVGANDLYALALDKSSNETRYPADPETYHTVTLAAPPDPNLDYIFDANGCLILIVEDTTTLKEYTYDFENRLISVVDDPDGSTTVLAEFQYDGLGRRIVVKLYDDQGAIESTTRFIYDGDGVIEEHEWDGQSSSWIFATAYIHGLGIDNVLALTHDPNGAPSSYFYYHYDGIGSVTELTDSSGSLAQACEYDAWGNATIYDPSSSINNRYLFTGREWDASIALYYYRARHYDPALGRFLQTDPAGYGAGINLYIYVGSTPTAFVDPTGMKWDFYTVNALPTDEEDARYGVDVQNLDCTRSLDPCDASQMAAFDSLESVSAPAPEPCLPPSDLAWGEVLFEQPMRDEERRAIKREGMMLHQMAIAGMASGSPAYSGKLYNDYLRAKGVCVLEDKSLQEVVWEPVVAIRDTIVDKTVGVARRTSEYVENTEGRLDVSLAFMYSLSDLLGTNKLGEMAWGRDTISGEQLRPAQRVGRGVQGALEVGSWAVPLGRAAWGAYVARTAEATAARTVAYSIDDTARLDAIGTRLQTHVDRAAAEVDALGMEAFTPAQQRAILGNPRLQPMYRGNRIDVMARGYVRADPLLNVLDDSYNLGPDFVDSMTGTWWDMTTPGQWPGHVNRYGTGGIFLDTTLGAPY